MVQFDCIEKPLSRAFYVYGRFIARHPMWFIFCPMLLTAALGSGFYNLNTEYDVEKLFTPEDARSKDERSTMKSMFPVDEKSDNFSAFRMSTLGEYGRIIVMSTDGNVLEQNVFDDVEQLDQDIRNITVEISEKTYKYSDLCASSCDMDTLILLNKYHGVTLKTLSYPFQVVTLPQWNGSTPRNISFFLGSTIGGVSKTTENDTVAKAWSLIYFLQSDGDHTEAAKTWEDTFLTTLENKSYKHITVTRFTAHSLEDELKRSADAVFPLFSILFSVLINFSIVSCMSADWVRSKPTLGNLGVLSAGLAVVSAFGLVLHAGNPFIAIVGFCPFLVLGKSSLFLRCYNIFNIPQKAIS